ncbi:MAG: mammalian cell entry protein [Nocardia sp.]|uniref:MlaD family protein n=1 Tax=Nocardia sp. TaxID=1821 RepID=UPI00261899D8|nr:MlaD family protein [Nocardia sp.]MCU1646252.1 mammalian cell entry protein [Nocardia sp.]
MSVVKWYSRFRGRTAPVRTASGLARIEVRRGVVGVIAVVSALIVSGVVYVYPAGHTTYTAELAEADSVKAGDDVRMAGVPVGKVRSLELGDDGVRMSFTVDDGVFVGDQTTLDIRMLTIVGGHYVALSSAGSVPVGDTTIPSDRVHTPYSLVRAFQDAAAPIAAVDGDTLRRNFAAMDSALNGSPDGLRRAGAAMESMVTLLNQQSADISATLGIADEYLSSINGAKSILGRLISKLNVIETVFIDKRAEVLEALDVTGGVLSRVAAMQPVWERTLRPMATQLAAAVPELQSLGARLDSLVASIHGLLTGVRKFVLPSGEVGVDQSAITISAPALCIPVPGKGC